MWGDFFLRILSLANQCVHHQIAKCLERFSATLCHSEHFLVVNPQLYFYFAEKTANGNLRFVCTRSLSKVGYLRKSLNTIASYKEGRFRRKRQAIAA